jgi:hypothetical protein
MIWIALLPVALLWMVARPSIRTWISGVAGDHWILDSWLMFFLVLVLYPDIMFGAIADYLKGRA